MHRRKIKRRGRFFILKFLFPLFLTLAVFLVIYILFPGFVNTKIVSPIGRGVIISEEKLLKDSLKENKIKFSSIEISSDSSYFVKLSDGGVVIISPKKDIGQQISSLQLMLNRLTIEGKRIKLVDFRYDRPIIRL